jgi:cell division protein ZipA
VAIQQEFFESTSTESAQRAAILPAASEDVSYLLPPIPVPFSEDLRANREYLPNSQVDWIVDVTWKANLPRSAAELGELFRGPHWNSLGSHTFYGRDAAALRWTYLISGNGPGMVTELKVAWPYVAAWDHSAPTPNQSLFEDRLETIERVSARWEGSLIHPNITPGEAAQRAASLSELHEQFNVDICLQLKAPFLRKFDGRKVWDVLTSLGLRWGDMDYFHWRNDSDIGPDHHFSVSTSTAPGYFLPEQIAARKVKLVDLVFGFPLARSIDPLLTYERMFNAVEYAQRRLGGRVLENGRAPDRDNASHQIRNAVAELTSAGFRPGTSPALYLF